MSHASKLREVTPLGVALVRGWHLDGAGPICAMNEGAKTEAEARELGAKWLRAQGVEVEC